MHTDPCYQTTQVVYGGIMRQGTTVLVATLGMACGHTPREIGTADTGSAASAGGITTGSSNSGGDAQSGVDSDGSDDNGRVTGFSSGHEFKFDMGDPSSCVNLECNQMACASPSVTTTIAGTVYDPSGTLPLPNVQVYIPNAEVAPIADGLTCDQCTAELSGSPLVSAVTDSHGRFVLENAPSGANIPLVMQVGKWRRQVTIPVVDSCETVELADAQLTRLPRSQAEGNLPRIALTTGDSDPLFCLLRRLGLDDSEYGVSGSDARIHFYRGSTGSSAFDAGFGASPGAMFPNAPDTLWDGQWQNYDVVLMSCEGAAFNLAKNGLRVGLRDYLDMGGRVFATHFHYSWMQGDAPADLASVAGFGGGLEGTNAPVQIDTSFPKGQSLAEWLAFVDGASPLGQFTATELRDNTQWISDTAQRWVIYGQQEQILYFSFNTPVGAADTEQCGRMVYSDLHVSNAAGNPDGSFPSACNDSPLSEQEKVLLYMLFDLSACISPDVPAL